MSNNRKVLLFTDWYEPGFKAGGPIQSCKNIIDNLSPLFEFYIVTSDRDLGDKKPYEDIPANQWITISEKVSIIYTSPGWLRKKNIVGIMDEVSPECVYLNSMFSYRFSLLPLWTVIRNYDTRIVLAPRGMLNKTALDVKRFKKNIFLSMLSKTSFADKVIFHATNEQEKMEVENVFGTKARIIVAGNIPHLNKIFIKRTKNPGNLKCIFIGRIHPIKNLLYALNVFRHLRVPATIDFDIYGVEEDAEYYRKCFEAARLLEGKVNVSFRGTIENPEIFDILTNYHLFFLPTKGENFGHAIFEALSAGCPALISDRTSWNDIEENNAGWSFSLSDEKKFLQTIEKMAAADQQSFDLYSRAAFNYAQNYFLSADFIHTYSVLFGLDNIQVTNAHSRS